MDLKEFLFDKGYIRSSLKFLPTNQYALCAKLNGVTGLFIVDTGASISCIDIELAQHFKLKNILLSDLKATGAGSTSIDTKTSDNNMLQIGKLKCKLTVITIDLNHIKSALKKYSIDGINGIIGADILNKNNAVLDYKNNSLYLTNKVLRQELRQLYVNMIDDFKIQHKKLSFFEFNKNKNIQKQIMRYQNLLVELNKPY